MARREQRREQQEQEQTQAQAEQASKQGSNMLRQTKQMQSEGVADGWRPTSDGGTAGLPKGGSVLAFVVRLSALRSPPLAASPFEPSVLEGRLGDGVRWRWAMGDGWA